MGSHCDSQGNEVVYRGSLLELSTWTEAFASARGSRRVTELNEVPYIGGFFSSHICQHYQTNTSIPCHYSFLSSIEASIAEPLYMGRGHRRYAACWFNSVSGRSSLLPHGDKKKDAVRSDEAAAYRYMKLLLVVHPLKAIIRLE